MEISEILEEIMNDLLILQKIGISQNPQEWDFVHFFPLLSDLQEYRVNKDYISVSVSRIKNFIHYYFHIPFCTGLCIYCFYYKIEKPNEQLVADYLEFLLKEFEFYRQINPNLSVHSISIGGGTPTYLSTKHLEYFLSNILKILNFSSFKDITETTIEASPETLTFEKLKIIKDFGVNRLSVGVQSFNDKILSFINRRHSSGGALKVIWEIEKAGFENYNIDLMYGFPYETLGDIEHSLKIIEKIKPPSITYYRLWFAKDKPFGSVLPISLIPQEYFPDTKEILKRHIFIDSYLLNIGYKRHLGCWYILDDKFKCYNQIFRWENNNYIGMGPSSYSYVGELAFINWTNLKTYMEKIKENKVGIERFFKYDKSTTFMRKFILGLKLDEGFNLGKCLKENKEYPQIWEKLKKFFEEEFKILSDLGYLIINENVVKFTFKGYFLKDEILMAFIKKLRRQQFKLSSNGGRK